MSASGGHLTAAASRIPGACAVSTIGVSVDLYVDYYDLIEQDNAVYYDDVDDDAGNDGDSICVFSLFCHHLYGIAS
jgi:hypothetical protein